VSFPRPVLEGTTYMITRRTTQRQFLLKPSALTNQIFLYCLAVAAERTSVVLHAVCVLSNHYHLVATDPLGRIPAPRSAGSVRAVRLCAVRAVLGEYPGRRTQSVR